MLLLIAGSEAALVAVCVFLMGMREGFLLPLGVVRAASMASGLTDLR
jgi:hypothetical protein